MPMQLSIQSSQDLDNAFAPAIFVLEKLSTKSSREAADQLEQTDRTVANVASGPEALLDLATAVHRAHAIQESGVPYSAIHD
jgi:hypothetical protein